MSLVRFRKTRRITSGLLAFVLSPLAISVALAETIQPLDHIVVTATKTGETALQDTAIAITLVSEEDIEASDINNVEDLVQFTPGLSIARNTGFARVYMRGVGTNLDFLGSDPSTTIHADGIYIGRPQAIFSDFLGVERIEVLRGPQGTLYGRNSTGGTINVISKTPDSEKFLETTLELGNYDKTSLKIGTGGSLIGETVTGNLFAIRTKRDGFVENKASTGEDLMDDNSYAIKGSIRIELNDRLEFIARADATREDEIGIAYKPTLTDGNGEPPAQDVSGVVVINDPWEVNIPADTLDPGRSNYKKDDNNGGSFEINYQLDGITLTSLTGYRSLEQRASIDSDWTEVVSRLSTISENQDQISQEFRLSSQSENLDWTAGAYYLKEDADWIINVRVATLFSQIIQSQIETETKALFGQGTYHFSDLFAATAGVRYSEEEKTFDTSVALPPGSLDHATESWYTVTPKVGFEVRPNEDQLVYFTVSEGFKSGGYNASQISPAFDPEELRAYEIGFKSSWLDESLFANITTFYYDYKDMQVQSFFVPGEGQAPQAFIRNAAESTVKGAEVETKWLPNESFDLGLNVAYLDAKYDKFLAVRSNQTVDVSGNRLTAAPRWKINAIGQAHHNCDNGRITTRLEWAWQTEQYYTEFNEPVSAQGTYGIWNTKISYAPSDESWNAALYVKNIDNKDYTNAIQDFSPLGVTRTINEPRTYGIIVAAQFF